MNHSPTPWAWDEKIGTIIHHGVGEQVIGNLETDEDSKYAIACVNACAGMEDPVDEIWALKYSYDVAGDAIREVYKQQEEINRLKQWLKEISFNGARCDGTACPKHGQPHYDDCPHFRRGK